jgi:hypothetical protein
MIRVTILLRFLFKIVSREAHEGGEGFERAQITSRLFFAVFLQPLSGLNK